MSRYLDLQQNFVLYGDALLPQDAFYTTDTAEMKLVSCVFELARSVAELKLTETELALYSAAVLLSPGEWHESAHTTEGVFPSHPPLIEMGNYYLSKIIIEKRATGVPRLRSRCLVTDLTLALFVSWAEIRFNVNVIFMFPLSSLLPFSLIIWKDRFDISLPREYQPISGNIGPKKRAIKKREMGKNNVFTVFKDYPYYP